MDLHHSPDLPFLCIHFYMYIPTHIGASTQEKTKGLTLTLEKMAQVKDILSTLKGVLKLHVYP